MDLRAAGALILWSACAASAASAQGLANQRRDHEPFENLRIIDPTVSAEELATMMLEISRAIGSEEGCLYCHVGVSGQPLATWDFAADSKENKDVARVMMRMVDAMNDEYLNDLPGHEEPVSVSCRTCHAGRPRPVPLESLLLEVVESDGVDAAEEQYRSLRERYYAADAYDFNEYVLRRLASQIDPEDPRARLSVLELNLEFHPDSWRSLLQMGEAYLQLSEPELAEISFQRSLGIRPSASGLEGFREARSGEAGGTAEEEE